MLLRVVSDCVVFLQFLGRTEVDQPKGIEVVKEGIRKLQFGQEIKKSESSKLPKRELTISINGVAIQDPETKVNILSACKCEQLFIGPIILRILDKSAN